MLTKLKKYMIVIISCFLVLISYMIVLAEGTDIAGKDVATASLIVQSGIGSEGYMAEAKAAAADEWWKLFWCVAVLTVIIIIISYVRYGNNIWAANATEQHEKVKRLKLARHIAAGIWVVVATGILIAIKIYKEPWNIKGEFGAYNTICTSGVLESSQEYPETSRIIFDIVARKCIFKRDEVFGTVIVEGTSYVILPDSTEETDELYTLIFREEGGSLLELGLVIKTSKDFDMFIYHDPKLGPYDFIAPAETIEEAEIVYASFKELK